MDDVWLVVVPIITATAVYFARSLVDAARHAIREFWDECKMRRRHREQLETLREQNTHARGLRAIDLESDIVKHGMTIGGYQAEVRRRTSARINTDRQDRPG